MASVSIDDVALPQPGDRAYLSRIGTCNDELPWLMEMFAQRVMADGCRLTRHEAERTEVLVITGRLAGPSPDALRRTAGIVATASRRRAAGAEPQIVWSGNGTPGDERAMSLAVALGIDEQMVVTAIFAPEAEIAIDAAENAAIQLHLFLDGYFRLWCRHRAERRRAAHLAAACDLNSVGIALLDRTGRVCHLNTAMRRLTDAGDGLRCLGRDGGVVATDLGSAVRLQVAVQHALAAVTTGDVEALTLVCRRPRGGRPLVVAVAAIQGESMNDDDPVVVIHAVVPDADIERQVRSWCTLYGLSPVETAVVVHLTHGQTLDMTAAAMRIKPDTARSYLKQIFIKTGTSRQADLIRLVLASRVSLEPHLSTVP